MFLIKLSFRIIAKYSFNFSYLLSIASFSLALSVVVVGMLVMTGYEKTYSNAITQVFGHVILKNPSLKQIDLNSLVPVPYIEWVQKKIPFVNTQGIAISESKDVSTVVLQAIPLSNLDELEEVRKYLYKTNIFELQRRFTSKKDSFVLVGRGFAKKMHLKKGDEFTVVVIHKQSQNKNLSREAVRLKVAGFLDLGLSEYNSRYIIGSEAYIKQKLNLSPKVFSGVRFRLHNESKVSEFIHSLKLFLPEHLTLQSWKSFDEGLLSVVQNQKTMILFVLFIIVLVAGFNITGQLYILINKQNKEMSILRVIGLSSRQVFVIVLLEAFVLGVVSLLCSFVLGLLWFNLFTWFQKHYFPSFSEIYRLTELQPFLSYEDTLWIVLGALGVCLGAALKPAYRASSSLLNEGLKSE